MPETHPYDRAGIEVRIPYSPREKAPDCSGAFLFGKRSIDQRHQRLGIFTADDKPVPFVVAELNDDDFLISTPE